MKAITAKLSLALGALALALPTLSNASEYVANAEGAEVRADLDIPRNSVVTRGSGYAPRGGRRTIPINLEATNTYTIIITGCEDMFLMNAKIFDDDGEAVFAQGDGRTIVMRIQPEYSGKHLLWFEVDRSTPDGAHWAFQVCDVD